MPALVASVALASAMVLHAPAQADPDYTKHSPVISPAQPGGTGTATGNGTGTAVKGEQVRGSESSRSSSGLPMTGTDVTELVLAGLVLIGAGASLRWRARHHTS